jgi:cyclopropane-fatty-acyl-phospholipid synthase
VSGPLRYRVLDVALGARILPDPILHAGARAGALARVLREQRGGARARERRSQALLESMRSGPIAEQPAKANEQHYELPAEFLALFLGPRRKYSACLWPDGVDDIGQAEEHMLALTCERARIRDGVDVLDLGCGWGALSLYVAERYPEARVLAVSNSHRQREWIESERDRRGLRGLEVRTADVNSFVPERSFDRVVSVEMFEHMRNWAELLRRVRAWLAPEGSAFVHVFSHRSLSYRFEGTWAAERFFTAGMMPSHGLLAHFDDALVPAQTWAVSGLHYARTLRAWLARLDERAAEAREILAAHTSVREARRLLATWRLFLISTAEMWSWRGGDEWMVSHYLLEPRGGSGKNELVRDAYSA